MKTPTIKEEVMVLDANMADKSFNERMKTDQYNPAEELRKSLRRAFFTEFIISAQMNHVSLKILGDNM